MYFLCLKTIKDHLSRVQLYKISPLALQKEMLFLTYCWLKKITLTHDNLISKQYYFSVKKMFGFKMCFELILFLNLPVMIYIFTDLKNQLL